VPAITQSQAFRRGLHLAALLWTEPRRASDLARELHLEDRDVRRLLAGLREGGLAISVQVRDRTDRYYRLDSMPSWLESAIRDLALPARRR
jgi:transcription initiation factor IIE alpha subunit